MYQNRMIQRFPKITSSVIHDQVTENVYEIWNMSRFMKYERKVKKKKVLLMYMNQMIQRLPKIILGNWTCSNIHIIILRQSLPLIPHPLFLMLFPHHRKSVIHHILLQGSSRWSWQIVNSQRRWISFQHFQHGNNDVCFSHKFPLSHNMNNHL